MNTKLEILAKAYAEIEAVALEAKAAGNTQQYMMALNEMGKISAQANALVKVA